MKTRYVRWLAIAVAMACWPAMSAPGQSAGKALADRLQQLEAETQALRGELEVLRQQQDEPVRLPETTMEVASAPASPALVAPPAPAAEPMAAPLPPAAEPAPPVPLPAVTMDGARAEIKKLMWSKGDFKIIPYGSLWTDMIYETERTYPGPYTLWVPSRETEGEDAFYIDARRTRLGLDVEGPRIPLFCCAKSSGRVEIDFMGDTALENKGTVLLRHAYWQVKDDYFCLLVGQTWDVISPLYPGTLSYSVGWDGGNIGYRRAQFRADRYLHFSPEFLLILQGSLDQNVNPDSAIADRETSGWPIVEGRVAARLGPRGEGCLPAEIGVSGHIGETGFDVPGVVDDARSRTWSLNFDAMIPITPSLRFQAEFFTGENLGAFLGGIGQGVNVVAGPDFLEPIRSTGGWFDLKYDWTCRLHSCVGYGVDDPNNEDVHLAAGRTYNQFIFGNITFDITKKFITGIEVADWKTNFVALEPGHSVVTQWMVQYSF